jgi:hypothetical protein
MEKGSRSDVRSTRVINLKALIAKEERRLERANYSVERKLETVQRLKEATRELRSNTFIVQKGSIIRD